MTINPCSRILSIVFSLVLFLHISVLFAQEQDEATVSGLPLENAVTGRDLALRLRFEAQVTEDRDELVDIDPAYKSYPSSMYAGEARISQSDKLNFTTSYETWENPQGLDAELLSWSILSPLTETQRFQIKYMRFKTADATDRNYLFTGISGYIGKIYSSLSYRYMTQEESGISEHQISEYLSWTPIKRLLVGTQIAVSFSDASDLEPWYGRLFGTLSLVEGWTSLRCEYQHYKYVQDLSFDEFKAHIYQRIGSKSLVKVGARYYQDSNSLNSLAPDIKLKHYFSSRFSAHVGYRYYKHSEDTDFDTYLVGVGMIF